MQRKDVFADKTKIQLEAKIKEVTERAEDEKRSMLS